MPSSRPLRPAASPATSHPARPDGTPDGTPDGERLAKRLARQLPCSRSEAERYIESGFVTVDGVVVDVPQFRVHAQTVALAPGASLAPPAAPTFVLHKPAGIDATGEAPPAALALLDPRSRHAGDMSGIALPTRPRADPRCLTPLEAAASGLVVFSLDPRVVRKLLEDAVRIEHETLVEVAGDVSPPALDTLRRMGAAPGREAGSTKVSIGHRTVGTTGLRFAAKGHVPGRIEAACAAAGLQVATLRRTRIGRVPLGALPVGQWRLLLPSERF